jgi:hypothetical protein
MRAMKQTSLSTPIDPAELLPGAEQDFKGAGSRELTDDMWERRVFIAAVLHGGKFTTYRWLKREQREFPTFRDAIADVYREPQSMIYAHAASGRFISIVAKRYNDYARLYLELMKWKEQNLS